MLCWHRGRLAVAGSCVLCWVSAMAGLVHDRLASWQALRAMLGWHHDRAFTWRVSIMAGLACHVGVALRRVGIAVVLHAMMAWR